MKKIENISVAGLSLPLYIGILSLVLACMYANCIPEGIVGAMLTLMVLGAGFDAIGKSVPGVRIYLGGSVVCILGGAAISFSGAIPGGTAKIVDQFVNETGFLVFYIAALITGSLFNIDRTLLLKATLRLLPTAVISIAAGVGVIGGLSALTGGSFAEGLLYVAIPMTSGGMTAGAVPLSAIYAQALGADAGEMLTKIAPATVLGNIVAIIYGALANRLGQKKPSWSGQGRLVNDGTAPEKRPAVQLTAAKLCTGLVISLVFYQAGALCHHFVRFVPIYAWMIILVVLVKSSGALPEEAEEAARIWGQFAIHSWTAAALTGIGMTLIDVGTILSVLSPSYFLTVIAGVTAITLTAAFVGGRFMGFYPLEAAIAAGMCTTNMGGSGNVAVLSSAERMELLPFAQIVTRSCGALMLTLGGLLVHLLNV